MERDKERVKLIDLIVDAKRTDPETGSFTEWLADFLLDQGVMVPTDGSPSADRLRMIEEILCGDKNEFDIDRLRELLKADREGRCFVLLVAPDPYRENKGRAREDAGDANVSELECRVLLGDRAAQEECTRQGILLPCPFCRGIAERGTNKRESRKRYGVYHIEASVQCTKCTARVTMAGPDAETAYKYAEKRWNTRPALPIGWMRSIAYGEVSHWRPLPNPPKEG